MISNFQFLSAKHMRLFERASKAEEFCKSDERTSFIYSRLALELAIEFLYELDDDIRIIKFNSDKLNDKLKPKEFKQKVSPKMLHRLHVIKNEGNKAVHNGDNFETTSVQSVTNLYLFLRWFFNKYLDFSINNDFDPNLLPKPINIQKLVEADRKALYETLHAENSKEIDRYKKVIDEYRQLLDKKDKLIITKDEEIAVLSLMLEESQQIIEAIQKVKDSNIQSSLSFTISEIGLTEQVGLIWGRVFVNINQGNNKYFAIKYFAPNRLGRATEQFIIGKGNYQDCDLFKLFTRSHTGLDMSKVMAQSYDHIALVTKFDKVKYGTPSILLKKLMSDLKKQFMYKKGDEECIDNGHYKIDGIEFMSIWTFKKNYNTQSQNETKINGQEGIELLNKDLNYHVCKPDYGSYSNIKIYSISDLKQFYNIV